MKKLEIIIKIPDDQPLRFLFQSLYFINNMPDINKIILLQKNDSSEILLDMITFINKVLTIEQLQISIQKQIRDKVQKQQKQEYIKEQIEILQNYLIYRILK